MKEAFWLRYGSGRYGRISLSRSRAWASESSTFIASRNSIVYLRNRSRGLGQRFRCVQFVELAHVGVQQLVPARRWQIGHVTCDHVAGVRPSRILMRVIVRPHAVVDTPPGKHLAADDVVKKRRVDLLGKIFAGQPRHGYLFGVAVALERFVALAEPEWHPADFVLYRDDLQPGVAFEHPGKDHIKERVLDLARLL